MNASDISNVIHLGFLESNAVRRLADDIDAGAVTHVVVAERSSDGEVKYSTIGGDDLTYLIGMLERVQMHMHLETT